MGRDMGDESLHGPGPGGAPSQGLMTDHGEAAHAAIVCYLGLTSARDIDTGIGVQRDGGVCSEEKRYSLAIHCDTDDSEPLRRYVTYAGGVVGKKVVGTGGSGPNKNEVRGGGRGIREGREISGDIGYGVAGN